MDRRNFMRSVAAASLLAGYSSAFAAPVLKQSMVSVDSEGKPFSLDNFAGRVCLVSFFTAACNLCSHDLTLMREFYGNNRSRNFSLIGVNLDAKKSDFVDYATFFKQAAKRGSKLIVMDPRGQALKRHAWQMMQFKNGTDVARLRDLLGHASVTTTSLYLRVLEADLEAVAGCLRSRRKSKTPAQMRVAMVREVMRRHDRGRY